MQNKLLWIHTFNLPFSKAWWITISPITPDSWRHVKVHVLYIRSQKGGWGRSSLRMQIASLGGGGYNFCIARGTECFIRFLSCQWFVILPNIVLLSAKSIFRKFYHSIGVIKKRKLSLFVKKIKFKVIFCYLKESMKI